MDVRLSPEQRALREAAAQVVDRLGPTAVGQLDDTDRKARLDAAVVESGWRELRTADDDGAPWASAVEVGIIAEELARGCADTAFVGPILAAELRRLAGAPAAEERETVALTTDLGAAAVAGSTAVAIDARGATRALALQPSDGGYRLASIAITGADSEVDLTRATIPLSTSDVEAVPGASLLDDAGLTQWTALGLAAAVADLVGVMEGATRLTVEYAKERRQYGEPIGRFQALQHMMADMPALTEGARSSGLHAAWAVDALPPDDALGYASMAKAYAARSARVVCETSIQVHAGIGNTWECMAHIYLRRAQLATDLLGGIGTSLDRVLVHAGIGAA